MFTHVTKQDFAGVITLRILRWEDDLGSAWISVDPQKGGGKQEIMPHAEEEAV